MVSWADNVLRAYKDLDYTFKLCCDLADDDVYILGTVGIFQIEILIKKALLRRDGRYPKVHDLGGLLLRYFYPNSYATTALSDLYKYLEGFGVTFTSYSEFKYFMIANTSQLRYNDALLLDLPSVSSIRALYDFLSRLYLISGGSTV